MQKIVIAILLATVLAGCFDRADERPAAPDDAPTATIFHNGTIWTGATDAFAQAVAVAGDRIVAVGTLGHVRASMQPESTLIDLEGRMLLPGLHDTHNHLLDWINGAATGSLFSDDPAAVGPTTFDPTTGTANQQVIAGTHVCHWGVQHGESSGESLVGRLPPDQAILLGPNLARDSCYLGAADQGRAQSEWLAALKAAEQISASFGLTSHVQAGIDPIWFDIFLDRSDQASLRWNLYLWPEGLDRDDLYTGVGDEHVRVLGVKIYSDGWLGPRTAAMHANYGDRPHNGFQFYEQPDLDGIVQAARDQGLKVTAHAIGDRAVDAVMAAYETASESACTRGPTCGDPRYSIEHASVIQGHTIGRIVELGVIPSVQLSFPTSDAHWIDQALGEGAGSPYPWQTMVDAGIILAGSSDWPIEVLPPLWGIERAVTRQEVDDSLPEAFEPGEAVAIDTALRMITINAAILEFRDHELGSLEVGKLADLVVLGEDLFQVPVTRIADVPVVATMVGGQWVHGRL